MSSSEKKRKTTTLQSNPNLSLPDDLLLSIVARVSRLYYPTLSLVSKSFRSLLASPDLYKARSLLRRTDSCLYVCFHLDYSLNTHWFTLCRRPDQTLTNDTSKKNKSSGYVLATVPIPYSPPVNFSSLVVVGSNIYNIGGSIGLGPSSSVLVLDCQSHIWRQAPSLRVELMSLSASVHDRNIYVAGKYKDGIGDSDSLKNLFEVFNTKTQVWDPEPPIPCSETKFKFISKSVCIDGKFHVAIHDVVVAYNSKEDRWDYVEPEMDIFMYSNSYCVVGNVLYSGCYRSLRWYDTEVRRWKNLKGLVGLPSFPCGASIRLADYGGKLAVLWDEDCLSYGPGGRYEKMIWCGVIALERCKSFKIWGKVEWFDHVLTVPTPYNFVKVLAATV